MLALLKGADIGIPGRGRVPWRRRRLSLNAGQAARVSGALGIALIGGLTAILAAPLYPGDADVAPGQPAPREYLAPRAIAFESDVLTNRARERAAEAIAPIYSPSNPSFASVQAQAAIETLDHIRRVRLDPNMDRQASIEWLQGVEALRPFSPESIGRLVDMDPEMWQLVSDEVPAVVSQTMREPIRPDGVASARSRTIAFVRREIDPATSSLIAQLAAAFVVANTEVDADKTEAAREVARQGVEPVSQRFAQGETIVRKGDILTSEDVEALRRLGMLRGAFGLGDVLATLLFAASLVAVGAAVLERLQPGYWLFPRRIALAVLLILVFAFGARYAFPDRLVMPFAYPAAAVAMTVTVLLGIEMGIVSGLVLSASLGMVGGIGLAPAIYVLVGSLAGSVVLGRVERFSAFFTAGTALAASNIAVAFAFHLSGGTPDLQGMLELGSAALVSAALSTGLAAAGYLTVGSMLGITTSLQLLELARPDHPLLRELQVKAPGTYHHSIVLSNLAEAAAQAIGANTLLIRVGAYYHDIGKTVRPYFFVENQVAGANVHAGLDAHASARIIIAHVPDGAALCRRHGLPDDVIDFVWQHHGTTQVEYFYHQAVELLGEEAVDPDNFQYPGPRPQTREAAILMLADGSEAAVRAAAPESREEIVEVVNRIIRRRLNAGELDDANLTLRDLKIIRETFVATLQSLYHPRIKYPDEVSPLGKPQKPKEADEIQVAAAAGSDVPEITPPDDGADTNAAARPESEASNGSAEEHAAVSIVDDSGDSSRNGSGGTDSAGGVTEPSPETETFSGHSRSGTQTVDVPDGDGASEGGPDETGDKR